MATLISPNGTMREVTPANGVTFTLQELHGYVGGYIEQVTLAVNGHERDVLFVNEDGLREQLAHNPIATALVRHHGAGAVLAPSGIVGSAIRCLVAHAGQDYERVY